MATSHTITIVRATSGKRLAKQYTPQAVTPYPMVKTFNSYETSIEIKGQEWADAFAEVIRHAAKEGSALLKGQFTTQLQGESRKGRTLTNDYNSLLVVDIDGLNIPSYRQPLPPSCLSAKDIENIVRDTLRLLPSWLRDATCVANPSASMGLKTGVYMHLFFILSRKISPKEQKSILRYLNYASKEIRSQCALTASKLTLHYPIDISMSENSRIIYVANPAFVDTFDPIAPDARVVVVRGENPVVSVPTIKEVMKGLDPKEELIAIKNELRRQQGLPIRAHTSITQVDLAGKKVEVTTNPDPLKMTEVSDEGDYVRYNVGEGDSNAYWVFKSDPRVVRNFKNEPFFLFEVADPEGFARHCERYPFDSHKITSPTVIPFCFYSPEEQTYYTGTHNLGEDTVLTCYNTPRYELANTMSVHGGELPEPIPHGRYEFAPNRAESINLTSTPVFVNRFTPTKLMHDPPVIADSFGVITTDNCVEVLQKLCPNLYKLMYSMAGCGEEEIAYFVNWLAYIYQYRERAQTIWLFHGVEGTGKGLFMEYVLTPIFERYVTMRTQTDLEERYNDWIQESLIYVIDEFRLNDSREMKIYNKLKNMATESHIIMRRMFSNQIRIRNFSSGIFFSNDVDALKVTGNDRRSNIAPRQQIPLYRRYPELEDTLLPALEREVPLFAGMLKTVTVDIHKVRTPLDNEAKVDLKEVMQNAMDAFADAISIGNLDYFLEALSVNPREMVNENDSARMYQLNAAVGMIRQALHYVLRETDVPPPVYRAQDILALYTVMGGQSRNAREVCATIRSLTGMKVVSSRQPVWQNDKCMPLKGYVIEWQSSMSNEELMALAALYPESRPPQFIREST